MKLETGICGEQSVRVSAENTAKTMGSGTLDVFATPALVALAEKTCWQSVAPALEAGSGTEISELRVDGGASVSSFLMQFQADMLRVPIDRPKLVETTAFGAAFLAGLACGVWESVDDIALLRQSDRIFKPEMDADQAKQYHDNWLRAVGRAEKWSQE